MLYEKLKSVVKISVALDMKETTIRNRLKAGGVRLEGNRKVKKIEGVREKFEMGNRGKSYSGYLLEEENRKKGA